MSEERSSTPSEASLGQRRRRRLEAEAARAAGASGPLSRKEIRRRRLEEEARLAAIATGELPMLSAESLSSGDSASSAEEAATDPAQEPSPPLSRRQLREQRRRELGAAEPEATDDTAPAAGAVDDVRQQHEGTDSPAVVTPERPGEITGTGRRPVVRAPHTASAIRSLDETGALSGIQPVVRDSGDPEEYGPEASSNPAEWSGRFTPVSAEMPLSAAQSPMAAPGPVPMPEPEVTRPAGAPAASGPAQPAWKAVTAASPSSLDDAVLSGQPSAPNRRSMRDRMGGPSTAGSSGSESTSPDAGAPGDAGDPQARSGPEHGGDPKPANPVVRVVRVIALVLAAILIGVLITLLWMDQNNDDDADPEATTSAHVVTEIALPLRA